MAKSGTIIQKATPLTMPKLGNNVTCNSVSAIPGAEEDIADTLVACPKRKSR